MRRADPDPETRVGICCGKHHEGPSDGLALFKIPALFRYRCAECFVKEVGHRHHLSHPAPAPLIVLP